MAHDRFYYPDFPKTCPEAVPVRFYEALGRYLEGTPTGGFLRSVLSNDLREAVFTADEEALAGLRALVGFVHNCMPSECWGSRDKVAAWLVKTVEANRAV
jgi:hypothetical protein